MDRENERNDGKGIRKDTNDGESERKSKTLNTSRLKKRLANRPYHRLHSIRYDALNFLREVVKDLRSCESTRKFPIVSNERCGTWYVYPHAEHQASTSPQHESSYKLMHSCYFKSTDGHYGTWNLSLKRLNLGVVRLAAQHGGCIIVDASGSKILPDSMSRTIPIWACVLNRIVARYRKDFGDNGKDFEMDCDLYTPSCVVSSEEHAMIESLIDDRVNMLYNCKAMVDPESLVNTLDKPLRPVWRAPGWSEQFEDMKQYEDYFVLVCISCSSIDLAGQSLLISDLENSFVYSPGAADDHSLWSRGLTPSLFWINENSLLNGAKCEDDIDRLIDSIVIEAGQQWEDEEKLGATRTSLKSHEHYHFIGNLGVALGSRRSGRPPQCWERFDAVLNVTDIEYDDILAEIDGTKRYLQLPVREGKKDRTELERWLAVGVVFILNCVADERKVLVHCAQGRDRSVAVLMAAVALGCQLEVPLSWSKQRINFIPRFIGSIQCTSQGEVIESYGNSGLSVETVEALKGIKGRNLLLQSLRQKIGCAHKAGFLATKESLRLTLMLIKQDREVVDPSRSTMQKVNRFFMSNINFD